MTRRLMRDSEIKEKLIALHNLSKNKVREWPKDLKGLTEVEFEAKKVIDFIDDELDDIDFITSDALDRFKYVHLSSLFLDFLDLAADPEKNAKRIDKIIEEVLDLSEVEAINNEIPIFEIIALFLDLIYQEVESISYFVIQQIAKTVDKDKNPWGGYRSGTIDKKLRGRFWRGF